MYKVYLDDVMIHHQNDNDLRLNTAKVEQELNKAGSFVYSMNQNHKYYGTEKKLKSLVTVYNDDTLMFRGRVLDIDVGFYGDRTVTCEGELSFLIDSIQRPYEFSGSPTTLFTDLLASHNSEVENVKEFLPGRVTVVDANDYITRSDSTYLNTRDSIDKKLVEPLGGYLIPRHESDGVYLDYLADLTDYNSQEVAFGENLLDLSKFISGTDIVTAVIPIGAEDEETGEKLSIADVNDGVDYVYDQEAVDEYGWIFQTVEFEDVTLVSNLLTKAYEVLEEVKVSLPAIELTAVDLNAVDCDIASFEIGKLTKVTSKVHDLSEEYLTWKRSINLLNPADSKLCLGGEQENLTSTTSSINKDIISIQEVVDTENGVLMAEKVQGVINLADTSLKAQLDAANAQDIVAMLFENVDPNSATYGAMAIGTQGIQISKKRNATDTGWEWGTAIDFQSIQAEMIIAGILSDKNGLNYWDLDQGTLTTTNMSATNMTSTNGTFTDATVSGKLTSSEGVIGGWKVTSTGLSSSYVRILPSYTQEDLDDIRMFIMGEITLSDERKAYLDANGDGYVSSLDYSFANLIKNGSIGNAWEYTFTMNPGNTINFIEMTIDRGNGNVITDSVSMAAISNASMQALEERVKKLEDAS